MRILSLGFPMPGPCVDNHTFANAPSFFDYDAVVVDPHALSDLIEEIAGDSRQHAARSGERVAHSASAPGVVGLGDLLRDRRDETARLLARGGIVVCFTYPNVVHERVAGLAGCDRYCWLPAPEGVRYDEPFLHWGEGAGIEASTSNHPFEPLLVRFAARLAYHAYFPEESRGTVIARSAGGAAVALELPVGEGRVIFLPPPARPPAVDERYEFSNALQEAIRQTLRLGSASDAPYWVGDYQLPGLPERLAAGSEAENELTEAKTVVAAPEETVEELERYRRLLWQEGRYGLEAGVRAALALLGFSVTPAELEAPAKISITDDRLNQRSAMLEVDASENAVGLGGHYRLRQRIEGAIAQGHPAQGLLVINGYRRTPPAERPAQYEDALRVAAERFRYCVATTVQLFHAVRAALKGETATVAAFRERLLTTDGILHDD